MRLGTRNSGTSIRPWAAQTLSSAPLAALEQSLARAEARKMALLPTPDSDTKRGLLAREDWLIRCLREELSRRSQTQRRTV